MRYFKDNGYVILSELECFVEETRFYGDKASTNTRMAFTDISYIFITLIK